LETWESYLKNSTAQLFEINKNPFPCMGSFSGPTAALFKKARPLFYHFTFEIDNFETSIHTFV